MKFIFSQLHPFSNQDDFHWNYTDFKGNVLRNNDDILVTNRTLLSELSHGENLTAEKLKKMIDSGSTKDYLYSVKDLISDPDKYVFVEPNSNMVLDLRISKYSGQILPIHAGRAKQLQLQYFGQANVGKTLLITQYSCETALFSWKKDKKKLCFRCDIPINLPVQNFRNKQIKSYLSRELMEPTPSGEELLPHSFFITFFDGVNNSEILLEFQDIAGENSDQQFHFSPVYQSDFLLFLISPADLEDPIANKKLEDLITLVDQTKQQLDCENAKVLVVLTMSDLFLNKSFKSEEKLQKLLTQNTLTRKHHLKLTMHENGYNMDEHKKRSAIISDFLENRYPNIHTALELLNPQCDTSYFLLASLNELPNQQVFSKSFEPYRIDELLLYILSQYGLFPTTEFQDTTKGQIKYNNIKQPQSVNKIQSFMKKINEVFLGGDEEL